MCDNVQYHGGTNFGRVAGGPYITTSYDYDAPLDEYGNNFTLYIYKSLKMLVNIYSLNLYLYIFR